MIYILSEDAGKNSFSIKGELHKYLIKVRRHDVGEHINFRNKNNLSILYTYEIKSIDGRSLDVELKDAKNYDVMASKNLHIGWCIVDAKSIEKVLPFLCEIGVTKITFISCDRSQKNFKLDFNRFDRILEASMQQCGRSSYIEFETSKNINEFVTKYPDTKVFDFCENILQDATDFQTVLIGCEGGFSKDEKEFLKSFDVFRLDNSMVMRSESAVVAVASKILL